MTRTAYSDVIGGDLQVSRQLMKDIGMQQDRQKSEDTKIVFWESVADRVRWSFSSEFNYDVALLKSLEIVGVSFKQQVMDG